MLRSGGESGKHRRRVVPSAEHNLAGLFFAGARVIMACRSVEKAEAAAEQIRGATRDLKGAGAVDVVKLDLGSLTSVRQCADQLLRAEQRVHLLVNNAGR